MSSSQGAFNEGENRLTQLTKTKEKIPLTKRPGFQVVLFLPLIVFMSGDLATIIANQVLIVADLKVEFEDIGYILAMQYLTQGVFTFIFGYLSDKMSRKKLLIFGGSLWSISSILCSFAPNIYVFAFLRVFSAIGLGAQSPVTFSLLSDIFPSESRSNSFAWWGIANMIGSLASGGIALAYNKIPTDILDREYSSIQEKIAIIESQYPAEAALWRTPFLVLGLIGLFCVFLALFVKEPKRASKERALRDLLENTDIDYSNNYQIHPEDLKVILTRKTNIFLVLNFFDNIASGVIVSYLITYITLEIGFSLNFTHFDTNLIILMIGLIMALGIALIGQFYYSKKGDRNLENGDPVGRIRIMAWCAVYQIPFMATAFFIAPSVGRFTIFKDRIHLQPVEFWIVFLLMFLLIGLGLAASFGGTPNWYASLIDGNLPEHRGTMIAVATLMDTIGRSLGAAVGGYFLTLYQKQGDPAPIGSMMTTIILIFGTISALMSLPAIKTGKKDIPEVQHILEERRKELEKQIELKNKNDQEKNKPQEIDKKDELTTKELDKKE